MNQIVLESPKFTIQSILDEHFKDYLASSSRRLRMTDHILKTVNQIRSCRTPRLGVYLIGCKCCGVCKPVPRSCKNRFCSKCGTSDTIKWVTNLSQKVADIKHYHIVFTLPKKLRVICKRNARLFYDMMFDCSQTVLKRVFISKGDLQPGIISVLHTNGSDLKYHPHIHTIVSAGGFNVGKAIIELSSNFLIGQRKLADNFRNLFLAKLRTLTTASKINLPYSLRCPKAMSKYIESVTTQQWIVNIEDPLNGAEKIIAYVGRYTKKSCISERRILDVNEGKVKLSFKDYKNSKRGEKPVDGVKTFTIVEFLDRLLQHVPLKGFKVVRYYGMYSSSNWKHIPEDKRINTTNLEDEYAAVCTDTIETDTILTNYRLSMIYQTGEDPMYCYDCKQEMSLIELYYEKSNGEMVHLPYEEAAQIEDG